ncbi:F0F1 ATP synthase subunit delta [Halieaceae bacterium]|jgi:F-type H+-transporting ATPase subunit delta|nr:F0F1 ATP synthase subunit delta [Halieaceae bacterium]
MAELSTLARPYARAVFEHALAAGALAQWSEQLATVAAVSQQEKMVQLLSSPSLTSDQLAQIVIDVCADQLDEQGGNFIKVVAANKRLSLLPEIFSLFALLKANQEKSVDVEVVSAYELAEATQQKLSDALAAKLERTVKLDSVVDSSLLGGVLIRAGDLVIDGSVRGRLEKLAEAMNS